MLREENVARDILIMAKQEDTFLFERFDNVTAWELGNTLKEMCEQNNVAVTIEIRLCRETVFFYSMPGTTPNNSDWVRRKRNVTELLQQSSYAVRLMLSQDSESLQTLHGLPLRDYASHGGSFPIRVRGVGFVGAATVSGLPQRDDHNYVVQAVATMLKEPADSCALP